MIGIHRNPRMRTRKSAAGSLRARGRRCACFAATIVVLLVAALLPPTANAQYFGRNKVRWEDFDFWVRRTEHFEVHSYPQDNRAAEDAARMAELWYGRLADVFEHQIAKPKPIILYANHADFQQTNVSGGFIGEGTGGFTEPLRDRVVLPLTPSYAETDHVLGHELVHAFQFDLARGDDAFPGGRLERLPLWMIEGLAEYLSQGRDDPQTSMWMRDALLRNELPDLDDLSGDPRFSPYHFGQAVWAYIAGRWGDRAAIALFKAALQLGVERAFQRELALSTEEFAAEWHRDWRTHFGATVEQRTRPRETGRRVLTRESTDARTNLAPAISPDGTRVAFLSTRGIFGIDLFLADAGSGEVLERLYSAASDAHSDALRFLDSGGAWSPDGKKLAFVAFSAGTNKIIILDANSRRVERRLEIPGVESLANPAWSPDGGRLCISGSDETTGWSDLYLVELDGGAATQLTNDASADLQPAFSPDGRTIAFVSDREETDFRALRYGPVGIYLHDMATGHARPVRLFSRAKHINPQFSPDGESLTFIADPDGVSDLYRVTLDTGEVTRLTRIATGVSGITELSPAMSVARESGDVMFSVLVDGEYEIHALPPDSPGSAAPATRALSAQAPAPASGSDRIAAILPPLEMSGAPIVEPYIAGERFAAPPAAELPQERYGAGLGLTLLGPTTVGISSSRFGTGIGGGVGAYFTDLLGDHQVAVALEGGSVSGDDISSTMGASVAYLNLKNRIQWGAGAAHIPYRSAFTRSGTTTVTIDGQTYAADVVEQFLETTKLDQGELFVQYPFSMTRRVEASADYTHYSFDLRREQLVLVGNTIVESEREDLADPDPLDLVQTSVAFVGDNSFFGFTSPVRGGRMRVEAGTTFASLDYRTLLVDLRRYFFLRPVSVALRGIHYGRYGGDAENGRLSDLFLGDATLVRGYGVDDIEISDCTSSDGEGCPEFERLTGSRIGVANAELRIPVFGTRDFGLVNVPFLPTELALFGDAGVAWTQSESPEFRFDRNSADRVPVASAGAAARILVGRVVPIQVYYAIPFQQPEQDGVWGFLIGPGW